MPHHLIIPESRIYVKAKPLIPLAVVSASGQYVTVPTSMSTGKKY